MYLHTIWSLLVVILKVKGSLNNSQRQITLEFLCLFSISKACCQWPQTKMPPDAIRHIYNQSEQWNLT